MVYIILTLSALGAALTVIIDRSMSYMERTEKAIREGRF